MQRLAHLLRSQPFGNIKNLEEMRVANLPPRNARPAFLAAAFVLLLGIWYLFGLDSLQYAFSALLPDGASGQENGACEQPQGQQRQPESSGQQTSTAAGDGSNCEWARTANIPYQGKFFSSSTPHERTGAKELYQKYKMHRFTLETADAKDNCTAVSTIPAGSPGIPKVVHFVFGLEKGFGGRPFGMINLASIRAAKLRINPDKIVFHHLFLPEDSNVFWRSAKPLIDEFRQLEDISQVFGRPVLSYAHKADIYRLRILLSEGGIYLDTDIIALLPFEPLLQHDTVLAQQATGLSAGAANAFIMARPNATFIREWYEEYRTFNNLKWDEHSVKLPWKMSRTRPIQEICVLPFNVVFYPLYPENHVNFILNEDEYVFDNGFQYAYHAWQHVAFKSSSKLSIDDFVNPKNITSFVRLIQPLIPEELKNNQSTAT